MYIYMYTIDIFRMYMIYMYLNINIYYILSNTSYNEMVWQDNKED